MSTIKALYGSSNQTITITLASLANNSSRQSTAIDNTSNLFVDVLCGGKIRSGSSGTSSTGFVNIYAYGTANGGTNYGDAATGTDGAVTLTSPPNLALVHTLNVVANSVTYSINPFALAQAFGGVVPDHWGLVAENRSGAALDATGGNHGLWHQGYQGTVA